MAYGTVNADVIQTSTSGGILGAGNASAMKNRIINGAMVIDQRNAGASVTATGSAVYSLDRWLANYSQSSKFTVQQNAGSVTPPIGFNNYLGVTSSSAYSIISSDYFQIEQRIEGFNTADLQWGTANAKTVTLSFWVRSSLTGTFPLNFRNSAGDRWYPVLYTISAANTWEQKSVTIAGDTTGTWLTTNGFGIGVVFGFAYGSSINGTTGTWGSSGGGGGSTSVVGTNGATFYITGVQLEVGSNATGFEYRQYGTEFALCQRYYETSYPYGSTIPSFVAGFVATTTSGNDPTAMAGVRFVVTKRATPTCVTYNAVSGASGGSYRTSDAANAAVSQLYVGSTAIGYCTVSSNNNTYLWHYTASAEL